MTKIVSLDLRKVPTIVIVHPFCLSQDTRISYGWCLLIQGYFCAVQNYAEKAELSIKVILVSKKKIGGNHAFLRDNSKGFNLEKNAIHCFVF